MKRYLKGFILTKDFVRDSIYDCFNNYGKWKRYDTVRLFHFYSCEMGNNFTIDNIKYMLFTKSGDLIPIINFMAERLYNEIMNHKIKLSPIKYEERYDSVAKKTRKIGISSMKQQIYDYIAVNALKPLFHAKIGYYQCASLRNKGQVFGKNAIETWIRTNPRKCKYIYKADVHHYYQSIPHNILKEKLKRDIKNDTVLYLVNTLIDTYEEGLCIGSYLSQFLANYYLSYTYHYVSECLYVTRRDKRINMVNHVLFYMDDILLLGSSKKNVKMASNRLEKYLNNELGLELKPSHQLFPLDSRPIDMMGYKIYTDRTTIRKRIYKRASKVYNKYRNKKEISLEEAYKIVSYNGYMQHTNSKKLQRKLKTENTLKIAKEVISNASNGSNI